MLNLDTFSWQESLCKLLYIYIYMYYLFIYLFIFPGPSLIAAFYAEEITLAK